MLNTSAQRDNAYIAETIAISVAAESGEDITVTISCTQPTGNPHAADNFPPMVAYIAEAATGLVLEVPSGGVAAGSRGTVGVLLTDGSLFTVTPNDNGFVDVVVTQTGADSLFLILVDPQDGTIIASTELSFT
jgi:hypothetical protein